MKDTLAHAPNGIGLAASQIGVSLRLFLVSEEARAIDAGEVDEDGPRPKKKWAYFVFINPVLIKQSRKRIELAEGCLSVPVKFGIVPRPEKVSLAWFDESGRKHSRGFTKFFARVVQHELDHLDGLLITDRAKRLIRATEQKSPAPGQG